MGVRYRTTRLAPAAVLAALALLGAPRAAADPGAPRASVTVELGGGLWLGDFAARLADSGAFLGTYALATTLRVPLGAHWGVEGLVGSACVIHPESTPIEGTFLYQSAGLYAGLPLGALTLSLGLSAGFQHATWLLEPYSSGFGCLSLGAALPVDSRTYAFLALRGRRSFFLAHTIPDYYGSGTMDNPTSLQAALGVGCSF